MSVQRIGTYDASERFHVLHTEVDTVAPFRAPYGCCNTKTTARSTGRIHNGQSFGSRQNLPSFPSLIQLASMCRFRFSAGVIELKNFTDSFAPRPVKIFATPSSMAIRQAYF